MKTMRERFDEYFEYMSGGYYASRIGRHAVHPDDIKHFIEQEIKKEREEIVDLIEKEDWEWFEQTFIKEDIINIIKNR